jgi:hypothetical protein
MLADRFLHDGEKINAKLAVNDVSRKYFFWLIAFEKVTRIVLFVCQIIIFLLYSISVFFP